VEFSVAVRCLEGRAGAGVRLFRGAQASELTPLNALKFGEICAEAGLPEGVLNIVTGYGETAGEALSLHEDVDKISFTGSIATARKLLAIRRSAT